MVTNVAARMDGDRYPAIALCVRQPSLPLPAVRALGGNSLLTVRVLVTYRIRSQEDPSHSQ